MLFILSPAKALDYESPSPALPHTQPEHMADAATLIETLKTYTPAEIGSLMKISCALAQLNVARYEQWSNHPTPALAKHAVLAFNGDVYEGLNANAFSESDLNWLQTHLRILSGLYGTLRPLDCMQPYRLEMGTKLPTAKGKTLYEYWDNKITESINQTLSTQANPVLVNLASEEYFKSVQTNKLNARRVLTPVFEDWKSGQYKIISFYAKRARGLFMRYACQNRIEQEDALKNFDLEDYQFSPEASDDNRWVFRRKRT